MYSGSFTFNMQLCTACLFKNKAMNVHNLNNGHELFAFNYFSKTLTFVHCNNIYLNFKHRNSFKVLFI